MTWKRTCLVHVVTALGFFATVAACGSDSGELGSGSIDTRCDGFAGRSGDCGLGGIDKPIAVGATLPVEISSALFSATTPELALHSPRPTVVDVVDGKLVAKGAGLTPIFLRVASTESVLDLIHVRAAVADKLRLAVALADGTDVAEFSEGIQLVPGEVLYLEVSPFRGLSELAGQLPVVWSASSTAVTLLKTGAPSRIRLVARQAGQVTVTATAGAIRETLSLEVVP